MSAARVQILNGSRRDATLAALKKAGAKAKDARSKRIIHRLAAGLKSNPQPPAARSRAPHPKEHHVAKKHARRATHRRTTHHHRKPKRRTRRNPTVAAAGPRVVAFRSGRKRRSFKRRVSGAFAGLQRKTGVNLKQVALIGVGIAGGSLLSSFVEKQTENYLPDLNPYARIGVVTLALGVGGYFVGKYVQKDVGTGIMAGAIGEAIRSVGRNLAPGIFAGTEEDGGMPYPFEPVPIKRGNAPVVMDEDHWVHPLPMPLRRPRVPYGWGNPRRIGNAIGHQLGDTYLAPQDVAMAAVPQVF